MNEGKTPEWTGRDIANLARDMGRPLPSGMKGRIMAKIDEAAEEMKAKRSKVAAQKGNRVSDTRTKRK